MSTEKRSLFWRAVLALLIVFALAGMIQMVNTANSYRIQILHSTWIYLIAAISTVVLIAMALLGLSWTRWITPLLGWTEAVTRLDSKRWKIFAGFIFAALPCIFSIAILHPYLGKYYFPGFFTRLALFWCLTIMGTFCARILKKELSWVSALGVAVLSLAALYRMATVFATVSDYPFAFGWSDASRYYGASLFFAERLYGQFFPLPVLHPTWHLLLTVPYLFGNIPIWIHRFWQAFLQIALTAGTGIVFVRRLGLSKRLFFWGIAIWAFIFLSEGQILFSLLVSVIIVLGWANLHKYYPATLLVLLASIWAGLSRLNWFPVPAILAAVLYLLEIPYRGSKSWAHYLWKPATWLFGGTAIAFAVNFLYNTGSGNLVSGGQFASSLTSDLLWFRLFPNPTYPPGILLAAFLASAPLILGIILALRRYKETIHPLRLAGILTALTILLLGGLVVSIKIGGGADLHNLDAYLVMLMLVGGYFYFRRWAPETSKTLPALNYLPVVIFAIIVPVWSILQTGGALMTWDQTAAARTVNNIRVQTEAVTQKHGEVLFITQRQLLALKTVNVPLIPEDEQDYLMEMVMSHNRPYLDRFQADLQSHRFGLIVADSYKDSLQGYSSTWGIENNLWVEEVVRPLNCYYEVVDVFQDQHIALYMPRAKPCK